MTPESLTLEIYVDGKWHQCAELSLIGKNIKPNEPIKYSPDMDYALRVIPPDQSPVERPELQKMIEIAQEEYLEQWPAFLMDLVPNGHNREHWLKKLGIASHQDGPSKDWLLLAYGAENPPGNLRIKPLVEKDQTQTISAVVNHTLIINQEHPGFTKDEIANKHEDFIEYATQNNAWASGGSNVQGQAAKFLAVKDLSGRFHVQGAIPENGIESYWIVKFPRGKTARDHLILEQENRYLEVARSFGLRCDAPTEYLSPGALFVPRFDRVRDAKGSWQYLGLESLYSACGIIEYGAALGHDEALKKMLSIPELQSETVIPEIIEYVRRDLLNIVMGNKDNHGRNTQFLKKTDGTVALSPVFDFAPMYLDEEGIARVMRWPESLETAGVPHWPAITDWIEQNLGDIGLREQLKNDIEWLNNIEDQLDTLGIAPEICDRAVKISAKNIVLLEQL